MTAFWRRPHNRSLPGFTALKSCLFITFGAVLMGIALELFLVPNQIIDGGITGISIILAHYAPAIALGVFILIINLPFLLLGLKEIGLAFAFRALYGIAAMSATTAFLHAYEPVTQVKFLAALYGGVLLGLGIGLAIRFGGALDGTEVVAILLHKRYKLSVGQAIMGINVAIFLLAGYVFGAQSAMYAIFTYYIVTRVMDFVVDGPHTVQAATIISTQHELISEAIVRHIGSSPTAVNAQGGYSKAETRMIYCVVKRGQLAELQAIVRHIDRDAFISIQKLAPARGLNHQPHSGLPDLH